MKVDVSSNLTKSTYILENSVIGNTRGFEPLILSPNLSSPAKIRNGDEIMKKFERKQTIKEWELEKGIEIKNPKGFWGGKNKIYNRLYTEKLFRKCARLSEIRCKTDKGLAFLEG